MIKNCKLFYQSWKYWHSPKNHALGLAIVTAYDIYLEVMENTSPNFNPTNQLPVSFFQFRDILSKQMLSYDPIHQHYPGDSQMRIVTSKPIAKRTDLNGIIQGKEKDKNGESIAFNKKTKELRLTRSKNKKVTKRQFQSTFRESKRFCQDVNSFGRHLKSVQKHNHPAKCAVCGLKAYKKCGVCGVALHNLEQRGEAKGKNCFVDFHDKYCFGVCFEDRFLLNGVSKSNWKPPTNQQREANKKHIQSFE